MNKVIQESIKRERLFAESLVRYANHKSRVKPSEEWVREVLSSHLPFSWKTTIAEFKVTEYGRNEIIKTARFSAITQCGKAVAFTAYQDLKGRTPEEKEHDKTAMFPSGLFKIFRHEVTA